MAEDREHRARVHKADVARYKQTVDEMNKELDKQREAAAAREGALREKHAKEVGKERDAAFAQAKSEHERVLAEAASHAERLQEQHDLALAEALSQKDQELASASLSTRGRSPHSSPTARTSRQTCGARSNRRPSRPTPLAPS